MQALKFIANSMIHVITRRCEKGGDTPNLNIFACIPNSRESNVLLVSKCKFRKNAIFKLKKKSLSVSKR